MKKAFMFLVVFALVCVAAGAAPLDAEIENAAIDISGKLKPGTRVAIVAFKSDSDAVSDYIMEELTYAFMDKGIEVADRTNLPYVRQELQLAAKAGEESDRDAQQIGKFIGAEMIISGDFISLGDTYRLRVTTVSVEKATRGAGARYDVRNDGALQTLLAALNNSHLTARANQRVPAKTQKSAGAWLDEGISLASQRKFTEAIAAFTQAIAVDVNFSSAYYLRGKALQASISKVSEVTQDFNLTITSSRTYTGEEREVANRAIVDYTQALKIDPTYTIAYNSRGFAYMSNGDYDRAIADYTQALKLDLAYAFAYNNRGLAYMNKRDYDRAIADYTQAIRLNPAYPVAYNNRGLAYMNKKDYDRAIADYTQAIRLNPNPVNAYYNRGSVYHDLGDYDRAIADYTQTIKFDPNYTNAYYFRGDCYVSKKDLDRAIADYNQVIKLDPHYADAYYDRGVAYYGKGQKALAIQDMEKALSLDPTYEAAKNALRVIRGQ